MRGSTAANRRKTVRNVANGPTAANDRKRRGQRQDAGPNILSLRDLAKIEPQAAERGEKGKRQEKQEAPVGVEPTMADLQSAALATWLRRQHFRRLENVFRQVKRICGTWKKSRLRRAGLD